MVPNFSRYKRQCSFEQDWTVRYVHYVRYLAHDCRDGRPEIGGVFSTSTYTGTHQTGAHAHLMFAHSGFPITIPLINPLTRLDIYKVAAKTCMCLTTRVNACQIA